jgi:3-deoxy-D-manno-octulosonic-acid transferase
VVPEANVVITTVTEQGLKLARQSMGRQATCLIAPLDLPGAVNRAIKSIKPDIYLCLETELWPNTLAGLRKSGTPCFLLNARLSERSFRRYSLLNGFTRQVLAHYSGIAAISSADAERLITLGADPGKVTICGNVKYDLASSPDQEGIRQSWQLTLGLSADTPVLVAGSTHGGEELLLLEAFRCIKQEMPTSVLVLAPRHLERLATVQTELAAAGAGHDLLSLIATKGRRSDIVVVDSMGDLATLYSVADYVFCGGSLVERGGHNIMEAARWGRPVLYGPSMKDFSDAKELLEASGGGFQVDNPAELVEKIMRLAGNPALYQRAADGARMCASGQKGAADRQLQPVLATLRSITERKKFQPASAPA